MRRETPSISDSIVYSPWLQPRLVYEVILVCHAAQEVIDLG
jgi:hypothetical protein